MKKPELKPCPFCGGEAKIMKVPATGNCVAYCTKCAADVGRAWYWKENDAAKAWNRRVTDENDSVDPRGT